MNENKPRNITEKLIYEVRKRPVLWDRYNDLHSNRLATDREWLSLSVVMNKHKDVLRQKWKNLRDQFQREFRKIKTPAEDSEKAYLDNYTGRWIYFEQLLFLKDAVKAKQSSRNIEEVEVPEDKMEELIAFEEEPLIEDCYSLMSSNPLLQHRAIEVLPVETCTPEIVKRRYSEEEMDQEAGVKRKAFEEATEDVVESKRLPVVEDQDEIDDDLHFLKSLVPFMRNLNPVRKLIVRTEIQNILLRENLCDKCNGHSC